VSIWNPALLKNSRRGLLRIIEYKRHKLHRRLLAGITLTIWLAGCLSGSRSLVAEQGEEISFKHEAKHQEDEESANPNVNSTNPASAFVPAIFKIVASSPWSPTHGITPFQNMLTKL
jgi:hypothetical protein